MPESIAIMILGSASSTGSARNALEFAKTVVASGRRIERLFFYHEGVSLGTTLAVSSQDETNLSQAWQDFISSNNLDAVVCIASALKRGIVDATESFRYGITGNSLAHSMELSGLGQWIEALNTADRYIVFGA